MPIRPKAPVFETIPDEFARFMQDVAALIDAGDEAAWIEGYSTAR
ncbi:MAG TPA: hypothetical protein VHC19_08640 [Pirellulales bacterium]|nr:hypothetical protein [Pirellulales bacterium]